MKKNIEKIIEIPEGFQVEIKNSVITIKGKGKEAVRKLSLPKSKIAVVGKEIKITSEKATKKEAKLIGTFTAHIKNMINGIQNEFGYKLEICTVHFPVTVKIEGQKMIIKNFLGETIDRVAKLVKNTKVEVKGNMIHVTSCDREAAGQTAANIEKATKIRERDRRVFQDGIYIVEKYGGEKQ